jgi:hypothetical protein
MSIFPRQVAAFFTFSALIEMGVTKPINGTIHSHQSRCVHVADNAIVFNWSIGHKFTSLGKIKES